MDEMDPVLVGMGVKQRHHRIVGDEGRDAVRLMGGYFKKPIQRKTIAIATRTAAKAKRSDRLS